MTTTTTLHTRLLIDGEWRDGGDGAEFPVIDPATGETIASFAAATTEDCDAAVRAAERAFPAWSRTAPRARSELLYRAFEILREERDVMAELRLDFALPKNLPSTLPVLALRRGALFPAAAAPFTVGRPVSREALRAAKDGYLLVAMQREPVEDPSPSDLLPTAVIARVIEQRGVSGGAISAVVQGLGRVLLTGFPSTRPFLEASYRVVEEIWPSTPKAEAISVVSTKCR